MTVRPPVPVADLLDLPGIRHAVDTVLFDFLEGKSRAAAASHLPTEVPQLLHDFLAAGGKRLRPLLCVVGWHAAGGHGDRTPVIRVAASLEMFHAFALIHDDIMDNSTTRRGAPTLHCRFAACYTAERGAGAAGRLGTSVAILVGDLALAWSDELLHTAGLATGQLTAVLPVLDAMRTEVMYGQYLDVIAAGRPTADLDRSLSFACYKTAKYTVERPLHIGAALAGADTELLGALSAYALPLGEAFQLRDDLLGVFGDPCTTGKPNLDDLREGKHTALIALALQRAGPAQQYTLRSLLGNPALDEDDAERIRRILTVTRAKAAVEQLIRTGFHRARHALDASPFPPAATHALLHIADAATQRTV